MMTSKPLLSSKTSLMCKTLEVVSDDMYFKANIESTKVLSQIQIKIANGDTQISFDLNEKETHNEETNDLNEKETHAEETKEELKEETLKLTIAEDTKLFSENIKSVSENEDDELSSEDGNPTTNIKSTIDSLKSTLGLNNTFKIGDPIIVTIDKYPNGNNEIIIIDLNTNIEIGRFITTPELDKIREIFAVEIFPDNQTIICCGCGTADKNYDPIVFVWNIPDIINSDAHPEHRTYKLNFNSKISSFAICPSIFDTKYMYAVGFENGVVCLTSLVDNATSCHFKAGTDLVRNISFSVCGNWLITDSYYTNVWNIIIDACNQNNVRCIVVRILGSSVIKRSLLSSDKDYVYYLDTGGDIGLCTPDGTGRLLYSICYDRSRMSGLSISLDRKTLASFNDDTIVIWENKKEHKKLDVYKKLDFAKTDISNVFFTPNKREIIIQGASKLLRYEIDDPRFNVKTFNRSFGSWLVAVSGNH